VKHLVAMSAAATITTTGNSNELKAQADGLLTQGTGDALCEWAFGLRFFYSWFSSIAVKKYFSSSAAVSGASDPWIALRSMLSA
jgi:hypothetical protein